MKKTTAFLAALAVSLFCVNASAQAPEKESYLFNHWSVGVGLLEDFHVQATGSILPNLQIRVLYNTLTPYIAIADAITKNNPNIGGINPFVKDIPVNADLNGVTIKDMNLEAKLNSRELHLLVDFYPSDISSIHFTGGVIFDLSPQMVTAHITPRGNDGSAILKPGADGSGLVGFGGVSPDPNGVINVWAAYGLPTVRPYLGVGFGRPLDVKKRVSVNFDLGVAVIGGLRFYAEGYEDSVGVNWPTAKAVELSEEWCNTTTLPGGKTVTEQVGSNYIEYVGMASSFPVLPYARLTLNVRLF